jgi:hypothetical protein
LVADEHVAGGEDRLDLGDAPRLVPRAPGRRCVAEPSAGHFDLEQRLLELGQG